jgi:hypothetical protein
MTQPHMTQFDLSRWIVENEFASVAISVDEEGNSTRLRIEDLRTGTSRLFDALELGPIGGPAGPVRGPLAP